MQATYVYENAKKPLTTPDFRHISKYREKPSEFLDIPIYENLNTFKSYTHTARCFETSL